MPSWQGIGGTCHEEPQVPQTPRTGMRLLLHSSSSPHGATGDGEDSAGSASPCQRFPLRTAGRSPLPLQEQRSWGGMTTSSLVPVISGLTPGASQQVRTPQSEPAQCWKDAHPEPSTARSCFGSAGETGSTTRKRRRRGRLTSHHSSACISQPFLPNQTHLDSCRTLAVQKL